ncbi:MAG: DUF2085 domain-containing protein [Candidatus Edwardsbacteria bacterium]
MIDGSTQLLGWRQGNQWLRLMTGALAGSGFVFFAYPRLERE